MSIIPYRETIMVRVVTGRRIKFVEKYSKNHHSHGAFSNSKEHYKSPCETPQLASLLTTMKCVENSSNLVM